MRFEWDENKRRANVAKHDIDFIQAAQMLACTPYLVRDERKDYGEIRCQAVGEQDGMVLVVAFTMRGDGVFRIISARRANARERRKYGYHKE
ncbi:BrnT family toxin [Oleidesulfovibrio sp.]|uniref:BrnT family toxin n=1 Tax=Oleidesulfovibrio sp. TaxID=2909707 RepID=UPI003A8AF27E